MEKTNKMNKKGFTLLETLISTIAFGIIMILMFQMSSSFFNIFTKSSSKQSMNSKFIKAYTQMQKDFSISDSKSIYSYKNYKDNGNLLDIGSRWIALPIPIDQDGTVQGSGNSFEWSRIYIYYLACTEGCEECEGKKTLNISKWDYTNPDKYKYCSDKQLVRLVYEYSGLSNPYVFARVLSSVCKDIKKYTLTNKNAKSLPGYNGEGKIYKINSFSTEKEEKITIKLVDHKVIASDILDMDITQKSRSIKVNLSSVKKEEIRKILPYGYGKTDFTEKDQEKDQEKYSKYVDKIEFIINTNNT